MNSLSEIKEFSENELQRIHARLLEMAKVVCEILEKNKLPYMLALGTLLGAVRHKGFIPWDDDFDLFIFDDIYSEAIECLRKELPDNLFLEDDKSEPLFFHAWAHVKDLRSEVNRKAYPHDDLYAHKGISLDLYRAKLMKKCNLSDYINHENRLYIERRKNKGVISSEEYEIRMRKLIEDEALAASENDKDTTEIFAFPISYKCKFMYVDDVLPLKKFRFEDTEFYGPANAENILKNIYGNFRELPPAEQRIPHYSIISILD